MRRVLSILDTFRKVGPKACAGEAASAGLRHFKELKGSAQFVANDPETTAPGTELLWQNVKRVLLMCGGQEDSALASTDKDVGLLVDVLEMQRFVSEIFAAMDVPKEAASEMADALIAADYMGERSQGVHRLPAIVADLLNASIDPRVQPKVLSEREALALVDGQNAPGPVVANFCMDLAMRKARNQGIGYVAARRSNPIGLATWYACQALTQRLIGICMSNGPPILVPSGGIEPLLGGNLIACAAGSMHDQFLMNLGMAADSIERLELDYCNGQLHALPDDLALDSSGRPTTCPGAALRARRLRPFAPEHKGFGLAAMVDILCGVMTGARFATHLHRRGLFSSDNEPADLGQVYIAIDPVRFSVSFEERLADFHQLLRNAMPGEASQPALVPGDRELRHMQMVDDQGGFVLSPCTLGVLHELGERFNIGRIKTTNQPK